MVIMDGGYVLPRAERQFYVQTEFPKKIVALEVMVPLSIISIPVIYRTRVFDPCVSFLCHLNKNDPKRD